MKRNIHIAMAVLANICFAFAQNDSAMALQEVTVVETRLQALHIGQFNFKLDSVNTLLNTQQLMAGWLHRESAVHIRQYAPGSVATYSTRGATSAQSTVLWGGFSMNDAGTGLVDLSIVPAFLFEPALLRGGSATLFGSGAVGSVLNLSDAPIKKGFQTKILQQAGSFKTFATGVQLGYQNEKWLTKTSFFSSKSANNFTYQDPFSTTEKKLVRENAAFHQQHFTQLLQYKINLNQSVDFNIWLNNSSRETPRQSLAILPGAAVLGDKSVKATAAWHFNKNNHKLDAAYAVVHAWQNYRDSLLPSSNGAMTNDTNLSTSQQFRVDQLYKLSNTMLWQSGLLIRDDRVAGSNRNAHQQTASLQMGLLFVHKKVESQIAMRGEIWDGKFLPVSPFVSAKWLLNRKWSFSAYGGYNYRIPSMNDRFWNPGGNMNLQPENGITTEIATIFTAKDFQVRISGYYSRINEYIRWMPNGVLWIPENAKQVSLSGLDFTGKFAKKFGKILFSTEALISLNRSITLASHLENDKSVGQQLTYQPSEKATLTVIAARNGYAIQGSLHHVGSVSTDYGAASHMLHSYQLVDLSISKSIQIKETLALIQISVNNVLNQSFETIPYFPMPGINYQVTIKLDI